MLSESSRDSTSVHSDHNLGLGRPGVLVLLAAGLGLGLETLFYGRTPGLSVFVWCALGVVGLLLGAFAERVRPSLTALALLVTILVLGWMTFVRLEPLTILLNVGLILVLFAMAVRFLRHGQLLDSGWIDLGLAAIWVPIESWLRPWPVLGRLWGRTVHEQGRRKALFSILRGLALALPLLVVFGGLLGAADLVFGDYIEAALRWLDLERLAEYAGRTFVIVVAGVFFLGALIVALRPQARLRLMGKEAPLVSPFLGFTESAVILVALNLLFAAFVVVQFTYLFGGEANIDAAGYTYSEYARRGFGELVAVAALCLGLIYALASVTQRPTAGRRLAFSWLSALLVILVGVILVSAYQRLGLYENAYGFSRLRTYTHVALIWLAVTFSAFLVLLWTGRLRAFAPLMLGVTIGFCLTLDFVNVDAFIVARNTQRYAETEDIDVAYLLQLSNDAVPGLAGLARSSPEDVQAQLLPQLACRRSALRRLITNADWPSRHASHERALAELEAMTDMLEPYRVLLEYHGVSDARWPIYLVKGPDSQEYCSMAWGLDR
jgi:Domain of unknown function (DUF4173)